MNTSPSISKISTALLSAQKEIGGAKKGATNPFFKMKYSDLGSVMEACKDAFNNHGISVIQPIVLQDNINVVKTILLHESGEFIESSMKVSCKNPDNPQEMGSAITYAKRYALQALAFIPSEDDDGEKAMGRVEEKPRPTAPVKKIDPEVMQRPMQMKPNEPVITTDFCESCKKPITSKVKSYSIMKLGKATCIDCQDKLKSS